MIRHCTREMIKPDLNAEYKRLCSPTTPITNNLFGDNLAQQVKDIGDTNKLRNKLASSASATRGRGGPRGRGAVGGAYRGRGGSYRPWRGRGMWRPGAHRYFPFGQSQEYWDNRTSDARESGSKNEKHRHKKSPKD